ncbi:hypothetical protein SKAU_G00301960 [Synaphobranchus kaupii]|uniref:Uncharacterized protein n=1 Tax=Synaphobranchus kaupii TaxID=118154 RepID=A0A9Q1INC9_SYNKA|nr:hypothetical protein SKAU_G00301960 [Synaphobranchus kaupii]
MHQTHPRPPLPSWVFGLQKHSKARGLLTGAVTLHAEPAFSAGSICAPLPGLDGGVEQDASPLFVVRLSLFARREGSHYIPRTGNQPDRDESILHRRDQVWCEDVIASVDPLRNHKTKRRM